MQRSAFAISSVVLCLVASSYLAGTIRADRTQDQYLSLGTSSQYASVGELNFSIGSNSYVGSGTLVASDWVLTAAHCVEGASTETFTIGGQSYTADQWITNPSWTGDLTAGYDIALVHLTSSVSGITPATIYTGSKELNKTATYTGYGMTGTGLTGATTFDGQKRAGQNVIDAFYGGSNGRILISDFDNPTRKGWVDNVTGSPNPVNLEYLIAPGDSGGGVFMDTPQGTVLIGVNSFVASLDGLTNSDYGDISGATRVSAFDDWIYSIIGNTALPSSYKMALGGYGGGGIAAVPEPATMSLLGVGLLLFLKRRKVA